MNVNCSADKLKSIRTFIANNISSHFNSEDCHMVVLAVDEICANLISHSNSSKVDNEISVEITINEEEGFLCFEISDKGNQFNYNSYKEPTLEEIVRQKRKGGLGLILVRRIMDSVEFISNGTSNICRLTKKIALQAN